MNFKQLELYGVILFWNVLMFFMLINNLEILAIALNTLFLLLFGHVFLRYSERVFDILEEIHINYENLINKKSGKNKN